MAFDNVYVADNMYILSVIYPVNFHESIKLQ